MATHKAFIGIHQMGLSFSEGPFSEGDLHAQIALPSTTQSSQSKLRFQGVFGQNEITFPHFKM